MSRLELAGASDSAARREQHSMAELVADFTRELFQGDVTIHSECDPEFRSDYFIVSVFASGDVEQLVALHDRWHREIRDVAGEAADQYRLSVDVQ